MIEEELNKTHNQQSKEPINKAVMIKRTTKFAHDCVNLAMLFRKDKLGYHIQNQLIRCSTSVASNYRAANLAQSKAAFVAKLSIVIEEADESSFWLEFGQFQGVIKSDETNRLIQEANELALIFISSRKSIQTSLDKSK
jgi:four helix bundle protein